jgi:hypothetical protein
MAKILQKMVKDNKTHKVVYWIGFGEEKEA